MTPEERLDQLEPLISETTAILDRHTAQLRQHAGLLKQLVQATESNGLIIQQLLVGQRDYREELALLNTTLSQPTDPCTGHPGVPTQQLETLETRLELMGNQMEALSGKMDLILTKLIRVYINN